MMNYASEPLRVCWYCLLAIESREGRQAARPVYIDEEDHAARCDWCHDTAEECGVDVLYEI